MYNWWTFRLNALGLWKRGSYRLRRIRVASRDALDERLAYAEVFIAHALAYIGASVSDHGVSVPDVQRIFRMRAYAQKNRPVARTHGQRGGSTNTTPQPRTQLARSSPAHRPVCQWPSTPPRPRRSLPSNIRSASHPAKPQISTNAPSEVIAFSVAGRLNVIVAMLS